MRHTCDGLEVVLHVQLRAGGIRLAAGRLTCHQQTAPHRSRLAQDVVPQAPFHALKPLPVYARVLLQGTRYSEKYEP